eukprot:4868576-Alexandrium_andersonii.AAC.1
MNFWKTDDVPTRGEGEYSTDPGDLPEFWGIARGGAGVSNARSMFDTATGRPRSASTRTST